MKRLFKIGNEHHDPGKVIFAWDPQGNYLATAGRSGTNMCAYVRYIK